MRLLLVVPHYPPALGGAELQAERLARELDVAGVRVSVLTRPCAGEPLEETDRGIRIFRRLTTLPLGPLWGLTFMRSTGRWLRRLADEWDVVHNQQVGLHSWASVRTAVALGKPCLLRFACSGQGGDLATLKRRRFGDRLIEGLRGAGRLVALTSSGAAEIVAHGLPAERTITIPNGIDLQTFSVQPWPHLLPSDPVRLLYVGRLDFQKGLDLLLDALGVLPRPDRFRLRIVGTGPELEALRARAARSGLQEIVEFCGIRRDITAEYAWSEVVVLPSRFEGMPNVVLEAMACGRPVLGTRIPGTADLISDQTCGWLVPAESSRALGETLSGIVAQREKLTAAGLEGRAIVATRNSLKHVASRYIREYEALLSSGTPP